VGTALLVAATDEMGLKKTSKPKDPVKKVKYLGACHDGIFRLPADWLDFTTCLFKESQVDRRQISTWQFSSKSSSLGCHSRKSWWHGCQMEM